jgi:hypothetical protein
MFIEDLALVCGSNGTIRSYPSRINKVEFQRDLYQNFLMYRVLCLGTIKVCPNILKRPSRQCGQFSGHRSTAGRLCVDTLLHFNQGKIRRENVTRTRTALASTRSVDALGLFAPTPKPQIGLFDYVANTNIISLSFSAVPRSSWASTVNI